MWRKSVIIAITATAAILLFAGSGCEFSPTGLEDAGVKPYDSNFVVKLNPMDSNIVLTKNTEFSFNMSDTRKKILSTDIVFNDEKIYYKDNNNSGEITFEIPASYYPDGEYVLSIAMKTTSGTGSIADNLGLETEQHLYKWKVTIQKAGIYLVLREVVNEDGRCRISWDCTIGSGFQYYQVIKTYNTHQNYYSEKIYDKNTKVYYDSNIVSGKNEYAVVVCYTDQNSKTCTRKSNIITDESLQEINCELYDNQWNKIKWNRPVYYKNVSCYMILDNNDNSKVLFSTTDQNVTECTLNTNVLLNRTLLFMVVPKDTVFGYEAYSQQFETKPLVLPNYGYSLLKHCYTNDNMLYYIHDEVVYSYDLNTQSTAGAINTSYLKFSDIIGVAENNQYAAFCTYSPGKQVYFVQSPDYKRLVKLNSGELDQTMNIIGLSVTNDGRLFVFQSMYVKQMTRIFIYDLKTNALIRQDSLNFDSKKAEASSDGSCFLAFNDSRYTFFRIDNDSIVWVKNEYFSDYYSRGGFIFIPGTNKILILYQKSIQTWDCVTATKLSSFNTKSDILFDIDYSNGYVLTGDSESDYIHIYDPASSLLMKSIQYHNISQYEKLALLNSVLVCYRGIATIQY